MKLPDQFTSAIFFSVGWFIPYLLLSLMGFMKPMSASHATAGVVVSITYGVVATKIRRHLRQKSIERTRTDIEWKREAWR